MSDSSERSFLVSRAINDFESAATELEDNIDTMIKLVHKIYKDYDCTAEEWENTVDFILSIKTSREFSAFGLKKAKVMKQIVRELERDRLESSHILVKIKGKVAVSGFVANTDESPDKKSVWTRHHDVVRGCQREVQARTAHSKRLLTKNEELVEKYKNSTTVNADQGQSSKAEDGDPGPSRKGKEVDRRR